MKIKDKLRSIKSLEGMIMMWRFYTNPEFKQLCRSYYDAHTRIVCSPKNEMDKVKLILRIPVNDNIAGFFCNYLLMLNVLLEFEIYEFPVIVDWTESPYQEPEEYKGTKNSFEYYFEPVSGISLAEMQLKYQPVVYNTLIAKFSYFRYSDVHMLEQFAIINRKYIRLRKDVQEQLSTDLRNLLGEIKTVGVHVRGVEWGKVKGHPIPISLEYYMTYIDEAIRQYGFEQVFLATDSDETVICFQERYGKRLVYYSDVSRTVCGSKTLVIFDKGIQRLHHQYRMGYEILRDVATLTCCDGFVGGISNVAYAVDVFKMSREEKFKYRKTVHQEFQKRGISPKKARDLMRKGKY